MRRFGLIGYPLGHSFSRKYFTEKFAAEGISDAVYDNYPLEKIELFPSLLINTPGISGLNVTIPYKQEVIPYLSEISPEAKDIGAVNVVKVRHGGTTKGFNSDVYGFRESLVPLLHRKHYTALVLGTGGSSLAVRYVLNELGIEFVNVSRTKTGSSLTYGELTAEIIESNKLIINTTPLGMFPVVAGCPDIDYSRIGKEHILYDLVYNPELTTFLAKGLERGSTVTGGLRMLHLQAERSWQIWNDPSL